MKKWLKPLKQWIYYNKLYTHDIIEYNGFIASFYSKVNLIKKEIINRTKFVYVFCYVTVT